MANKIPEWKEKYDDIILNHPENIQEAIELKNKNMPQHLYKYYSISKENEYWKKPLQEKLVYLSRPQEFNDPYDCSIKINNDEVMKNMDRFVCEKLLKDFVKHPTAVEKNRIEYDDNPFEALIIDIKRRGIISQKVNEEEITKRRKSINFSEFSKDYIRVACFCEKNNSLLMWSHYAHNHEGFCIDCSFNEQPFASIFPVTYSNIRRDYTESVKNSTKEWTYGSFLCKAEDWSYEKEWRVISPYREIPYFESSQYIRAIYLGTKISQENEGKTMELSGDIPVYKMQLAKDTYDLYSVRIK